MKGRIFCGGLGLVFGVWMGGGFAAAQGPAGEWGWLPGPRVRAVALDFQAGPASRSTWAGMLPLRRQGPEASTWCLGLRGDFAPAWGAVRAEVGRDWELFSQVVFHARMGGAAAAWPDVGLWELESTAAAALRAPWGAAKGTAWCRAGVPWSGAAAELRATQGQRGWDGGVRWERREADFVGEGGWSRHGGWFVSAGRRFGQGWLFIHLGSAPRSALLGWGWSWGDGRMRGSAALGSTWPGEGVRGWLEWNGAGQTQ